MNPCVMVGAQRITGLLDDLPELPPDLVCDNGPEFTSQHFDPRPWDSAALHSTGKHVDNCCIESFNGRLRDECLNQIWFVNLRAAQRALEAWRVEYNIARPHSASPIEPRRSFAEAILSTAPSTPNANDR